MSSSRDTHRLRLGLNPLTTTSLGSYPPPQQLSTPISAVSMSSSHLPSVQTPSSAIQPYNPQEWVSSVSSPAQASDRQVYTGEHPVSAPPPPPPYSPPRTQQSRPTSSVFDHGAVSASTPPSSRLSSSSNIHRPSPEPPVNQNFPPPPGAGGRGASRERTRFGLPSFGRRSKDPDRSATPDNHQSAPVARQNTGPGPSYTPESVRPASTIFNIGSTFPNALVGLPGGPPGARRAMSAGAVETPSTTGSRSGAQTPLDPGMAVPPPPPGPPPSSSRSHSVQSLDRTSVPILSAPTRRPPHASSTLEPVPPTPADWVDDSIQAEPARRRDPVLTVDTESARNAGPTTDPPGSPPNSSGLNRAKAVRHDKTILQRRTESRTSISARGSVDEGAQPLEISDIVVPDSSSTGPPPRPPKLTTQTEQVQSPQTADSNNTMGDSRNSTPRVVGTASNPHPLEAETPPFSPFPPKLAQRTTAGPSSSVAPKSLPTPPPQVRSASSSNPRDTSRPPSSMHNTVSKHLVVTQSAEQFATGTIERFQAFAASEAASPSDVDRVRLFADFMVNESRLRRERYSAAIGAMGSEIFDLTRDLFRPMDTGRRASGTSQDDWTPDSSDLSRSQRSSFGAVALEEAGGSSRLPLSPGAGGPNTATVTSNYMPSLSPILSMSVSDNLGDGSSRGRSSSRWWEADSQGDPAQRLERSKRESKYMGVPKDQWVEPELARSGVGGASGDEGQPNEYPPEKTGWHNDVPSEDSANTPQPQSLGKTPASSSAAQHQFLDVSRLVTLPPPYPRHHPAVNNNHPELASIRSSVRALSDMSELEKIQKTFSAESTKRREEFDRAAAERRHTLRTNLQQEINSGHLGYADAGAIETDFESQENDKKKELEKAEYERFQNGVIMPLNDHLTGRIDRATELYENLARRLFDSGQNDVDMPQEEGDDRPELLEKLTLLKWVFEARESLHRAIYDILSDRNNLFREVVVLPYRLAGNTEKMRNAEAFFDEDAGKRAYALANEVLNRCRDLRSVVDKAVQRGIALQLSAFWDIAPPLSGLLENIPERLEGFNIQIPPSELDENPSYRKHPMQYLLTLLNHTEKSTYQFIEAHTNLLCLLHEVKESVVHAKAKVLSTQMYEAGGTMVPVQDREARAREMRRIEDHRLTEDLKEKVRVVQDQWNSALAENIKAVKGRIREWLIITGGWDETLIEAGGVDNV